jgi:hypothetical protein
MAPMIFVVLLLVQGEFGASGFLLQERRYVSTK